MEVEFEMYELHSSRYRVRGATSIMHALHMIEEGEGEMVDGSCEYIEMGYDHPCPAHVRAEHDLPEDADLSGVRDIVVLSEDDA